MQCNIHILLLNALYLCPSPGLPLLGEEHGDDGEAAEAGRQARLPRQGQGKEEKVGGRRRMGLLTMGLPPYKAIRKLPDLARSKGGSNVPARNPGLLTRNSESFLGLMQRGGGLGA